MNKQLFYKEIKRVLDYHNEDIDKKFSLIERVDTGGIDEKCEIGSLNAYCAIREVREYSVPFTHDYLMNSNARGVNNIIRKVLEEDTIFVQHFDRATGVLDTHGLCAKFEDDGIIAFVRYWCPK